MTNHEDQPQLDLPPLPQGAIPGDRWVPPMHRTPEQLMHPENVVLRGGEEFEIDITKEAFTPEQAGFPEQSGAEWNIFVRGKMSIPAKAGEVPIWLIQETRASDGASHFSLAGPKKEDGSRCLENLGRTGERVIGRGGDITGEILQGKEFDETVSRRHMSISRLRDGSIVVAGLSQNGTRVEAYRSADERHSKSGSATVAATGAMVEQVPDQRTPEVSSQDSLMEMHRQQNIARAQEQIAKFEAAIQSIKESVDSEVYQSMWQYAADASSANEIIDKDPDNYKGYEQRMAQADKKLRKVPNDQHITAQNLATHLTNRNTFQRMLRELQGEEGR